MAEGLSSSKGKWLVAAAAIAVVAGVASYLYAGKARITGSTPSERIASICRVADEGKRGAAEAIAETAAKDPSPEVRQAALIALAKFPEPAFRSIVESAAGDPKEPGIRAAAATTLGAYGDTTAAERLLEMAKDDPDPDARMAAVEGLEQCGDDASLAYLVEVMEKSTDAKLQQYARSSAFRRLNMPMRNTLPSNVAMWLNDVELVKIQPPVAAAYKQAGLALELHPEYIIPEPGE